MRSSKRALPSFIFSLARGTALFDILLSCAWLCTFVGAASSSSAQDAPPPAQVAPSAPAQAYPQQTYPQQAYPQQAYPQQAYPQQAYPQQAYPQQAYPQVYAQPYPQQVYAPQPMRPRPPRPRRGLMISGIAVLAASYGVGLITGAALVDTDCCEEVGWSLFIPVAGPYLATNHADSAKGVLVLLGTLQVIGLGLTIGGVVQYTLSKNAAREQAALASLKLPAGRSVSFDVETGPRLLGPTMRLRF